MDKELNGIKSFLKKAAEYGGGEFDETLADSIISDYNNDYKRIIDDVGLKLGFEEEEMPRYRERIYEEFGFGEHVEPIEPDIATTEPAEKVAVDRFKISPLSPRAAIGGMPIERTEQVAETALEPLRGPGYEGMAEENWLRAQRSGWSLNQFLADTPDFLNRIAIEAINKTPAFQALRGAAKIAGSLGFEEVADKWAEYRVEAKDLRSTKIKAKIDAQKNILKKGIAELNPKHEMDIIEAAKQGDWVTFTRNLMGGVSDSFAPSLAMMVSGGALGTAGMLGSSTAVFGAAKYAEVEEQAPEMPESTKVFIAGANGALEGLFETYLGSGAIGKSFLNMVKNEGRDKAVSVLKDGVRKAITNLITKYPILAPLSEGVEEFGTGLSQNYVDKITGYRPDLDIMEGVWSQALIGVASGASHMSPMYAVKGGAALWSPDVRRRTKKEYEQAFNKLQELSDANYTSAVENITNNITDPEQAVEALKDLSLEMEVKQWEYDTAFEFIKNSFRYNQTNDARVDEIEKGITEFKDNAGNITRTEIDGGVFYIRNSEDLGKENAAIFLKDLDGNVTHLPSEKVTDWFTQTPEEVRNDIMSAQDMMDQEVEEGEVMQQQAAELGFEVGKTIETPLGKGTLQSVNADGTLSVETPAGVIEARMDESQVYKTAEQKTAEKEAKKAEETAAKAAEEVVSDEVQELSDGVEMRVVDYGDGASQITIGEETQSFANQEERDAYIFEVMANEVEKSKHTLDALTPEEQISELLEDTELEEVEALSLVNSQIETIDASILEIEETIKATQSLEEKRGAMKEIKALKHKKGQYTSALEAHQTKKDDEARIAEEQTLLYNTEFKVFNQHGEEGMIKQDGQTIVFETPERILELGNVDEVGQKPLADFNLSKDSPQNVEVTSDKAFRIGDENYTFIESRTDSKGERVVKAKDSKDLIRRITGPLAETIAKDITLATERKISFRTIEGAPAAETAIEQAEVPEGTPYLAVSEGAKIPLKRKQNALNALAKISNIFRIRAEIIHSAEIPSDIKEQESELASKTSVAFVHGGRVYIVADRIGSVPDAKKSYIHEVLVHKWLRDVFAGGSQEILGKHYVKFETLMQDVFESLSIAQRQTVAKKYIPTEYDQYIDADGNLITDEKGKVLMPVAVQLSLAEEAMAHLSEAEIKTTQWQEFLNRLTHLIRKTLNLTSNQFTQTDLINILTEQRTRLTGVANRQAAQAPAAGETKFRASYNTIVPDNVKRELTEDEDGNIVFVHYSMTPIEVLDPAIAAKTPSRISSAAELAAKSRVGGVVDLYTHPGQKESGTGQNKQILKIPKERVYYLQEDRLELYEIAKAQFKEKYPDLAFGANDQAAWVSKVANEHGFDITVTDWGNGPIAKLTKTLPVNTEGFDFGVRDRGEIKEGDGVEVNGEDFTITAIEENWVNLKNETGSRSLPRVNVNNIISRFLPDKKTDAEKDILDIKALPKEAYDGATLNLDGSKYEGVGLVVPADTRNTTQEELSPEMLEEFIEKNRDKIQEGREEVVKVGLYKFEGSDKVSIDLNIIVPFEYKDMALEFGKKAGQKALFNLDTFEDEYTGETGDSPKEFTDEEFREISRSLPQGVMPAFMEAETSVQKPLTKEEVAAGKEALDDAREPGPLADTKFRILKAREETDLNPSDAQIEAGNYKKGHVSVDGFGVTIENPKGSVRSGIDQEGEEWSNVMPADYGYIKGTVGRDKDQIDVFLGTFIGENVGSDKIYVIDQIDPETGNFDEHKIMMGFNNISEAKRKYNEAYDDGWKGMGEITRTNAKDLKDWLNTANTNLPFSEMPVRFRAAPPVQIFYSPTEKALGKITQNKGTPEQFKSMLLKNGAKEVEMKWMQYDEAFTGKKTITKEDIQQWVNENRVEVEEVLKGAEQFPVTKDDVESVEQNKDGEWVVVFKEEAFGEFVQPDAATGQEAINTAIIELRDSGMLDEGQPEDRTKFSQYQLPGGENYKEVLLTMPVQKSSQKELELMSQEQFGKTYLELNDAQKNNVDAYVKESKGQGVTGQFKSTHFEEPNILAHIRTNERVDSEGNKVLFIEEIQSDWAQEGRQKGFDEGQKAKKEKIAARMDGIPRNSEEWNELNAEMSRLYADAKAHTVPPMPFKKTDQWVNLALRNMVRHAAENGFDRIAWTTGEQQAERYDLSKQVDEVSVVKTGENSYEIHVEKDASVSTIAENIPLEKVEDYVGKDIAKKVEENKPDDTTDGNDFWDFTDADLKVGGEGMKAFYDKIVPKLAGKIGREFGAKVEPLNLLEEELTKITTKEQTYAAFERGEGVQVNDKQGEHVEYISVKDDFIKEYTEDGKLIDDDYTYYIKEGSEGQLSLPITPEMKTKAIEEGMPMFRSASAEQVSPAFRNWFKDSKVVDKKGNPKIVYHGTAEDFSVFTPSDKESGMWFTESPSTAQSIIWNRYVGKKEPMVTEEGITVEGGNIMPVYLQLSNPKIYNNYDDYANEWANEESNYYLIAELKEEGHDGIIIKESFTDSGEMREDYVVFEPNQIKSATANVGTYDPKTPDIRFRAGEQGDKTKTFEFKNKVGDTTLKKLYGIELKYNNLPVEKPWTEFGISEKGKQFGKIQGVNEHFQTIADYLIAGFDGLGFEYNSKNTAQSGTTYVERGGGGFTVRISDHIGRGGIFTASHDISTLSEAKIIISNVHSKKELDELYDNQRIKTDEANAVRKRLADMFKNKGLGVKVNHRTYQTLSEFKGKHPEIKEVMQTPLTKGAFKYEYLAPLDEHTGFPSKEYISWYNQNIQESKTISDPTSSDIRFRIASTDPATQKKLDEFYELQKASKVLGRIEGLKRDVEAAPKEEKKTIRARIKDLKEGAKLSKLDRQKEIKSLQSALVEYAKSRMPMGDAGKRDMGSILTALKNTQTERTLANALEKIDSLAGAVETKTERDKNIRSINRIIKWMTGYKKQGATKAGKFKHEDVKQFDEMKEVNAQSIKFKKILNSNNTTVDQKAEADAALSVMWDNIDAKEGKNLLDDTMLKIIELRRLGARASETLVNSINEDLQQIYGAAKEAKTIEDIERALERSGDKEFVNQFVRDTKITDKGLLGRLSVRVGNFTANTMGNWETIMTVLGGTKARDKFSLILNQVEQEMSLQKTYDTVLDKTYEAYGFKNKNELLKHIQELKKEEYELIQPILKGKRNEGAPNRISKMHIIDIYNAIKQDDIKRDMYLTYGDLVENEEGGPNREAQSAIGKERIDALLADLNAGDKAFADAMQEQVQTYHAKINEVFVRIFNRDLPKVDNYWMSSFERGADFNIFDQNMADAKHPSFTKERSTHRSPKPQDAFDKFAKHVKQAEWYVNMGIPIDNLEKIFRDTGVKTLIQQARGEGFYNTITKHIENQGLSPTTKDLTDFERVGGNILGNWVSAKIGLTPSVPFKQLTSVINYSENMPIHKWFIGFNKGLLNPKKTFDQMWEDIPYLKTRFDKGYSEALAYAMNAVTDMPKARNLQQSIKNLETIGTRSGDIAAIVFGGKPYLDYLIKEKGLSQKEAVDKFLLDTLRSQQSPFSSTLSIYQNSKNPFAKALFTFANTPSQYMRKMYEANAAYRHGDINAAQVAKIYAIYAVANQFLYIGAGALVSALMKGSDPDEDLWKNTIKQIALSTVGGLPIIRDLVDQAARELTGLHVYDDALPVVESMKQIITSSVKALRGDTKEIKKVILNLLELMGISAMNAEKLYKSTVKRQATVDKTRGRMAEDRLRKATSVYSEVEKNLKVTELSPQDQLYYRTRPEYLRAKAANDLKRAYASAKRKAGKLTTEQEMAMAEMITEEIQSSKTNISYTGYSYADMQLELERFEDVIRTITED